MSAADQKLTLENLVDYFRRGIKKPADVAVGIEWEKIGIHRADGRAIGYTGPAGVEAILAALMKNGGWLPELQNGRPIALHKDGGSITLEPGGQIELSGRTYKRLSENEREIHAHLIEIRLISEPLGIAWLGIGAQPISRADDIEWVPKERYAIMRELLADRGELTFSMMKETASIQVSLDYTAESDAMAKLRLALRLTPYLTAIFPNSPIEGGRRSAHLSRRSFIWSRTAPERAGIPEALLSENAGFRDYAEFALDVPMLFVVRDSRWLGVKKRTFRTFMKEGYEGLEATADDWETHLTGIFTEARLKHYVEIRSIDCQQTNVGLAAAAFLKGLFYDERARQDAEAILGHSTVEDIRRDTASAREKGLAAVLSGKPALDTTRRLLELAKEGLARFDRAFGHPDETPYLQPVEEILSAGRTPAEKLLDCGCKDTGRTVRHIIDCARI